MRITKLFKEFIDSEKTGGIVLIINTLISIILVNFVFGENYVDFWHTEVAGLSIEHWINDGLMAIFFLLIGLELEREIYIGELSKVKNAMLPFFGALGGLLLPAGIYLLFNYGTATQSGAGIPMATDIAFALGVLSLLGKRIPVSLKVFLTALAVIDDLCAILVIAFFYTSTILWANLLMALGIFSVLLLLNRLKVMNLIPYLIGGVAMWYFMLNSGIHATITGVLLAFAIPFGSGKKKSISYVLEHSLHKPVAFFVLPLFALANTAITFGGNLGDILSQNYSLGIAFGLAMGKPLGILLFIFLAVYLKLGKLPKKLSWQAILGMGFIGGIGFTMSVFITLLAFDDPEVINNAKLVILLTSLTSAFIGLAILAMNFSNKKRKKLKFG